MQWLTDIALTDDPKLYSKLSSSSLKLLFVNILHAESLEKSIPKLYQEDSKDDDKILIFATSQ